MAQKALAGPAALAEHGQHIFVYGHVRTNQIVYSLSRTLNNAAALKQLPYLGKQTVPATIRKDLWRPLCRVSFPSGAQGLSAFQRLREFRRRHEHEWNHAAVRTRSRVKVGRDLRDQKANSIADIAAVLLGQERVALEQQARREGTEGAREERRARAQARLDKALAARKEAFKSGEVQQSAAFRAAKNEKMRVQRALRRAEAGDDAALVKLVAVEEEEGGARSRSPPERRPRGPLMSMEGVRVAWTDVLDAEFARSWPAAVVHDALTRGGNRTRNVPQSVRSAVVAVEEAMPLQEAPAVVAPEPAQVSSDDGTSRLQRLVDRLKFGAR